MEENENPYRAPAAFDPSSKPAKSRSTFFWVIVVFTGVMVGIALVGTIVVNATYSNPPGEPPSMTLAVLAAFGYVSAVASEIFRLRRQRRDSR
jgi:uncharacterized membrane protein YhaH (DUF805 family)